MNWHGISVVFGWNLVFEEKKNLWKFTKILGFKCEFNQIGEKMVKYKQKEVYSAIKYWGFKMKRLTSRQFYENNNITFGTLFFNFFLYEL
jgi:hypothetical protein